jgi:hypothetical protein
MVSTSGFAINPCWASSKSCLSLKGSDFLTFSLQIPAVHGQGKNSRMARYRLSVTVKRAGARERVLLKGAAIWLSCWLDWVLKVFKYLVVQSIWSPRTKNRQPVF